MSGESTWRAYPETLPYVALNVRLWPRVVVLVAGPHTWRDLSPQQRGWLHGAAASAAAWAVGHAADADATGLRNACRSGTKAALALPFVEDDYARALAEAKTKAVPLFVEAWAPW